MKTESEVFLMRGPDPPLHFINVEQGQWVVIKPNFVKESKENDSEEWQCVITSPDLIRKVAEHVCLQLNGTGRVTICDAPQTDSSFQKIAEKTGLYALADDLSQQYGTPVEILDLRNEEWTNAGGIITERKKLKGDPHGSIAFNLGTQSLFYNHPGEGKYYGADYNYEVTNAHHRGETQEYLICATPILADVFIGLPKLKTHKKTGVSLSLKNLVGINADKNWLPHHVFGSPATAGDEYPDTSFTRKLETWGSRLMKRAIVRLPGIGTVVSRFLRNGAQEVFGSGRQTIRSGNWYGNNTTWRMTLDLNRCLLYGNPDGTFRIKNSKKYYTLIDGVIAMEGAGPMQGDRKECGIFIGSNDPVAADAVAATIMGFDWKKIPVIREAFSIQEMALSTTTPEQIRIISNVDEWQGSLENLQLQKHFSFLPHFGWLNFIELPNHEKRGYLPEKP